MNKEIIIQVDYSNNSFPIQLNNNLTKLKEFYLFENFIGQILSLEIQEIKNIFR